MILHGNDVGADVLNGFNDAIVAGGGDAQVVAELPDCLMVKRVAHKLQLWQKAGGGGVGVECDAVHSLPFGSLLLVARHGGVHLVGQVLIDVASACHVNHLQSAADAKHR